VSLPFFPPFLLFTSGSILRLSSEFISFFDLAVVFVRFFPSHSRKHFFFSGPLVSRTIPSSLSLKYDTPRFLFPPPAAFDRTFQILLFSLKCLPAALLDFAAPCGPSRVVPLFLAQVFNGLYHSFLPLLPGDGRFRFFLGDLRPSTFFFTPWSTSVF